MTDRTKIETPATTSPERKPYRAPVLTDWGTLRDVTMSAGKTAKSKDGGTSKGNKQTH